MDVFLNDKIICGEIMKKLLSLFISLLFLSSCSNNISSSVKSDKEDSSSLNNTNTLVAYFSVTNHTEGIANEIKSYLNSDIFEIVPKQEYTSEDIDYNSDCRAKREQNDDKARPEIKNKIEDISKYDTIALGYPIWWAEAPKIMYTFIESYNFDDKTILPFCTSGSSPIGDSAINLAKSAPKANWLEGKRFSADASKKEINSWLDTYFKKEDKKDMKLYIDNQNIEVIWEDNDSIKELKKLLPLTINMHEYGGFEQTGNIGSNVTRNDKQIDVIPGDIVLYNGNAISVFYAPSSWSYTKLGHIHNKTNEELNNLLNKDNVTFVLKGE